MKKYIIILLILILSIPFITSYLMVGAKEIPATVTIGSELGFNVDTDKLYFGTIVPGGFAERSLDLDSIECKKCLAVISKKGELAKWLSLSANRFIIKKGERKSIDVKLNVPTETNEGVYNGTLRVVFWKTF